MSESTDRELLAAHVAGDPEAFSVLVRRHRDRLWAVALRTLGDPDDAADALQDALVSAYRRAGSYRGDAAVTTWLHRVVVNACLDRVRREKVRHTERLPDEPDAVDRLAARGPAGGSARVDADPAAAAEIAERRRMVHRALLTLPWEQRAALVLVDVEGRSVEETAAILDVAPGTVKSRCSRGRARLADVLRPLLAEPPGNPPDPGRVPSTSPTDDPSGGR